MTTVCCLPTACSHRQPTASIATIEEGFMTPPDSVRVAANWWFNSDFTPEKVVDDLKSMKLAGITRVMICFDPSVEIDLDSDLWWQTIHQALKTAGELDMEVGISNVPSRSRNITFEQSMRRIVSAEIEVEGPGIQTITLPEIEGEFQDVAVVAYPVFASEGYSKTWTLNKEDGRPLSTTLKLDGTDTIRSIEVKVASPMQTEGIVKVKADNEWKEARRFVIDRSNVGPDSGVPIIISLPETVADEVLFEVSDAGAGQMEVILSERPKVERIAEKQLVRMGKAHDYSSWNEQPIYTTSEWIVEPKEVIVLTPDIMDGTLDPDVKEGKIRRDVPPGRWIVSRIAMVPVRPDGDAATPEDAGLAFDKMNKEHLRGQFDGFMGEILRRIPPEDRKTLNIVAEDSYDADGQNWTDLMSDEFFDRYHYSPMLYMPVLQGITVGSNDISERFLWDLRRLVADMVATEYIGGIKEIASEHGLKSLLKSNGRGGRSGDFLLSVGQSDEIAGDSRSVDGSGKINNRILSSGGHIYGKDKIWSEVGVAALKLSGTYPYVKREQADRLFAEGVNAPIIDLVSFPEETESTFVSAMDSAAVVDYLRRCSYLLQQGQYVADVAYFKGEDVPNTVTGSNPTLPHGYSFDFINADVLKNHASVKNGRLVLDSGMEYRVLMLPDQATICPEMIECIEGLVKDGLTVVGRAPERSPSLSSYPKAHQSVIDIASRLWSPDAKVKKVGKGKVWKDKADMVEVFGDMNILPDLSVRDGERMPNFIHRTLDDAEIYFISNPYTDVISITPTFRVNSDMLPQFWNAIDGSVHALQDFTPEASGKAISVPLKLEPMESAFIVFRKKA